MTERKGSEEGGETMGFWSKMWETDDLKWHESGVNIHLQKYFDRLRNTKGPNEKFNVFVPLCGKTLDIKWLLDKGCSVVGVEGVELGLQQLFKQHNFPFHTTPLQNHDVLYQGEGLHLKVYKCNIFDLPKYNSEKFDLVWDRGSFVAINPDDRTKYAALMKGLYAPQFSHLLEAFVYECKTVLRAPNHLPLSTVQQLLGVEFSYEKLEQEDIKERATKKFQTEFAYIEIQIFLICRQ